MSKPDIVDWLSAQWDHGHSINQQERCRDARDEILELRAIALSLADALERIERRDFLMADLKSVTTPERVATAALSDPRLLKLKGGV